MEQTFQTTSFIPKKSLVEVKKPTSKGVGILTFVSILILIGTIVSSVLVYIYVKKLNTDVLAKKNSLSKAQDAFEPTVIENLKELDTRITTASEILQNHVTVSPIIINILNANTLRKVQYTKFNHLLNGSGKTAKIQVKLSGKAESLPYVALQSKKLSEVKYVGNPIFSDIVTAKDNSVTFNLTFDVKPDLIIFSRLVDQLSNTPKKMEESSPNILPEEPKN